jgi:hypothetical protein
LIILSAVKILNFFIKVNFEQGQRKAWRIPSPNNLTL